MSIWPFQIFIDAGCPVCSREARWLRRLDRRDRLSLTDLTASDFDAAAWGIDADAAMRSIHGRWPDGRIVTGMDVFRAAYSAIGLGWLWAPTGWPLLRPLFDKIYDVFAAHRFRRRKRCAGTACGAPR